MLLSSLVKVNHICITGGYDWSWGGCSVNIKFGEVVSKRFLDSRITGKDAYAAMNLQNYIAGRKVTFPHLLSVF